TFTTLNTTVPGFAGAKTSAPGGGGQYGLFYPALGASQAATTEAWVFGLQQDGAVRSNVAIANLGEASASINFRVDVYNGDTGLLAGSTVEYSLPPKGWGQLSGILSTFGVSNGFVRVVRTAGTSRFVAYGVANDGASSDSGATNDGSYIAFSNQ
ncbi:MAG: hypothetical protein ABIT01_18515, partial [Thermoanaerobaculia bacterium]